MCSPLPVNYVFVTALVARVNYFFNVNFLVHIYAYLTDTAKYKQRLTTSAFKKKRSPTCYNEESFSSFRQQQVIAIINLKGASQKYLTNFKYFCLSVGLLDSS